ncbi:MAG TPA: sensor domain-containing diguanylate cyclase [Acidimicrobiia bacterium]|nr:sensor domain-containing diguanylate cyclase [Acidimicrobiia bacterium]
MWVTSALLNLMIAVCYFCISGLIMRGLIQAGEWRTNRLGLATAGIFYTCAVHHGLHTLHMFEPTLGLDSPAGLAMREAFDWHSVLADTVGAGVALYYFSLRRSYRALLSGPKMFDDKNAQLLRATLSALEEGVVVYQRGRGAVDTNEAAARILGVGQEQLLGVDPAIPLTTIREDGTPWPADELPAAVTFATGASFRRVVVGIRPDSGETSWLSCGTTPLRDATGEVEYVVATFSDVTAERAAAERLAWRAMHDELTGLANRAMLCERLEGSLAQADVDLAGAGDRGAGGPYAVLYCDLDGFKSVNDRYGHEVGDALLVAVGARLEAVMREGDLVARWGGDEFVVLAGGLAGGSLLEFAERLRTAIAAPFELVDNAEAAISVEVTLSVGVAMAGSSAPTVLRLADLALYEAKRRGRNRVVNAPAAV